MLPGDGWCSAAPRTRRRELDGRLRRAAAQGRGLGEAEESSLDHTITSLNPDGSGRTESRFRVPTRAPRDGRSLGARLDDGKIPGFQCRPPTLGLNLRKGNLGHRAP